jgi:nicotinamidase-related amidase
LAGAAGGITLRKHAARTAVLALDLISDFSFPDGTRVRRALANHRKPIELLLRRARAARVPVIYATDNLGAWRSDAPALIAHCTDPARAGAAVITPLMPEPGDEIVLKPRHSAFFGTPLAALLEDHRVDTLVVSGISAESCVWMTACDAHTRGYQLVIPADTMAGASTRAVRATLTGLRDVLNARVPRNAAQLRFSRGRVK